MHISIQWLNKYLEPGDVTPDQAEQILMNVGFPAETRTPVGVGDVCVDFEITSNRGDCLSHVGLAREIAAATGRRLREPGEAIAPGPFASDPEPASKFVRVVSEDHAACPLFTARVVRGCTVGPSPAWLRAALEAVGQRSISNVVDVTNFIAFESGNPCHAFDLAKLRGASLVIRRAREKEELTTLDGKRRVLAKDELVVADAERATSLAGVIGGAESEVTASTTDVVFEMATWDPVTVRRGARRHQVRTDASHRFERIVDARTIDAAADRAARLIAALTGGRLCAGSVSVGAPPASLATVRLRPERCKAILGIDVPTREIVGILTRLGVQVGPLGRGGDDFLCTIPPHRPDLTREIDLIEEIARVHGLDRIPVHPRLPVAVRRPQATELARREAAALLAGLGFYEAVTFSFTTPRTAGAFVPAGLEAISIDDARRGEEPTLRPSVLTGLLACRRQNQHAQNAPEGGVRLFEAAATFAQKPGVTGPERTVESINLGLLLDCPAKGPSATVGELQQGVRLMRGTVEALVRAMHGPGAALAFAAATPHAPAFDPAAYASITLGGAPLGYLGLIAAPVRAAFDLAAPVVGAELNLGSLIAGYPPRATITGLPQYPGIERDLSVVVPEAVTWDAIRASVGGAKAPMLEACRFVYTFRSDKIGKGKKSVTLRLRFRDPARTLRHDEVDGPVAAVTDSLRAALGAELRA